jgi:hypothetical protein
MGLELEMLFDLQHSRVTVQRWRDLRANPGENMRCVHCGRQAEAGKELALLSARRSYARKSGVGDAVW